MAEVSVVVPTYKEAATIVDLLRELEAALAGRDYEIVVVDDNSPDGTHQKVEAHARENPRVVPVLRTHEKGLATAVIEGLRRARGTYAVVMDSDFQHPPASVPALVDAALREGADCVVGSRYAPGGSVQGFPAVRKVISWGARTLSVWALPVVRRFRLKDPMSGFFLVRKDRVPLEALRPRGYKILVEVLARSDLRKVVEVGYPFQDRRAGQSKLRVKTQVDYFLHVAGLGLQDRENRRMATFGLVGLTGIVVYFFVYELLRRFQTLDDSTVTQEGQTYAVGLWLVAALAREAAIVWNFLWNDRITFHRERAGADFSFFHRLWRFHVASVSSFLVFLLLFAVLVQIRVNEYVASFLAILAGFLLNYSANVRWTYRQRRGAHG